METAITSLGGKPGAAAIAATLGSGEVLGVAVFEPAPPRVAPEKVLRIQGYSDLTKVRPAIRNAAAEMARLGAELSKPTVAYRRVPVGRNEERGLLLDSGVMLHCRAFPRTLAGCTEVAAFVLTVGDALDERVIALTQGGDLLEAVLLETAGWLCIEDATRQFRTHLRERAAATGCRITSRMGPGYTYTIDGESLPWPLEGQADLFRLFAGEELPVTLMESCAMRPKLSRSGIYGIAPVSKNELRAIGPGPAVMATPDDCPGG